MLVVPVALVAAHWVFKLDWMTASAAAGIVGLAVGLISTVLHRPGNPNEDQLYAARVLSEKSDAHQRDRQFSEAKKCLERALALIGAGLDRKLEGGLYGRLANAEKGLGEFAAARSHYLKALELAEQIHDISDLINRNNNLAALIGDDLRNPVEALPYIERAVELARGTGDRAKLGLMLVYLAKRLRESGELVKAREPIEEAERLVRSASQPELMVEFLQERACLALAADRKEEALEDLIKALESARRGGGHGKSGILERNIVMVREAIKNKEKVTIGPPGKEPIDDQQEDGPDFPPEIRKILAPAMEHLNSGRLVLAAEALGRALQEDLITNHPQARAMATMNLGDVLRELGRIDEAIALLREAVIRAQEAHAPAYEYGSLLNLGLALRIKGEWSESQEVMEQSLSLARKNDDRKTQGRVLMALGNLKRDLRDFAAAEQYYRQADEISREGKDDELTASLKLSLGNLSYKQRQWPDALPHFEQALESAIRTKDARLQGKVHHMLGNVLRRLGRLEEALDHLAKSVELGKTCIAELDLAGRVHDLAVVEQVLGRVEDARAHYGNAIEVYERRGVSSPEVAGCLENFGAFLVRAGNAQAGRKFLLQASRMDQRMISVAFAMSSEDLRLDFLRQAESRLHDLVSLIARGGPLEQDQDTVRECVEIVLSRKGVTLEALAIQRDLVLSGRHPELADLIQKLTQVRREIAQSIIMGQGIKWDGSYTEAAVDLARQKQSLEEQLSRRLPRENLGAQLNQVGLQTVSQMLPPESTLVEFLRFNYFSFPPLDQEARWSPSRYAAFVLPAGFPDQLQFLDLGDADPIDRKITEFLSTVSAEKTRDLGAAPASPTAAGEGGQHLAEAIMAPLRKANPECRQWFLAPDGELTRVPFEVLPAGPGQRVVDELRISYVNAGRDVLRFGTASGNVAAQALVIADPDYDLEAGAGQSAGKGQATRHSPLEFSKRAKLSFGRLPGTRPEGERIAGLLGVRPWMDADALEARLKAAPSPRILHIATHGFFLPNPAQKPGGLTWLAAPSDSSVEVMQRSGENRAANNPLLRSGLALSGANAYFRDRSTHPEAEDGILSAEDVTGLDLEATELVVLSACETGLGDIYTGEGVFGLRRAFLLAGARTLVVSLWKVPDQQTQELMVNFYRRLLDGAPRAEALHSAQLDMKAKYPAPFYWGAFICVGDPAPLFTKT